MSRSRRKLPRRPRPRKRSVSPILVVGPLALFTAVFLWNGPPPGLAIGLPAQQDTATDREVARFAECSGAVRANCVVDGDTFWYRGQKIRIADINTPETGEPSCVREAELGAQATVRLTELLNAGPFRLEPADRERDRYGRALRVVTRGGVSLGAVLEDEGLAEHWGGARRGWC